MEIESADRETLTIKTTHNNLDYKCKLRLFCSSVWPNRAENLKLFLLSLSKGMQCWWAYFVTEKVEYVTSTKPLIFWNILGQACMTSTGKKHFTKNGCDEGALQKKIRLKPPFHEAELQIKENE